MKVSKLKILSVLVFASVAFNTRAVTINVSRGTLGRDLVMLESDTDSELVITGQAATEDLAALRDMPHRIIFLDLSGLEVEGLPPYALYASGVEEVKLPASLESIGDGCFSHTPIRHVEIPAGVKKIGAYAFADCRLLESMKLPSGAEFGKGMFRNCTSLIDVEAGGITDIPDRFFEKCCNLSFILPSGVRRIGSRAFRGAGIESADLSGVKSIGEFAFADTPNLQEITIAWQQPLELGDGVFSGSSMPGLIGTWGLSLPPLTFANTDNAMFTAWIYASEIGEGSFAGNQRVDTLALTGRVERIGPHAFRNMRNLKVVDVTAMENIPETDPEAFSGLEDEDGNYPILLRMRVSAKPVWEAHPLWSRFKMEETVGGNDWPHIPDMMVTVRRSGPQVDVESDMPLMRLTIYDVDGIVLADRTGDGANKVTVGDLPADGILIIRVSTGAGMKILKLSPGL